MTKKIVIINHALVIPVFRHRWERLAEQEGYEVHLVIPKYWEQERFAEKVIYKNEDETRGNYHVHAMETSNISNPGTYRFKGLKSLLKTISPDVIYMIGAEGINLFQQVIWTSKLFVPKARIIFFTMNARGVPYTRSANIINKLYLFMRWKSIERFTDAALVHYPGCLNSLRNGGYKKPVFLQTQVGVDEELFSPNAEERKTIRQRLGFENQFVIGFLGRLVEEKGILDITEAVMKLLKEGKKVVLLCVGNGKLKNELIEIFDKNGYKDKLHITDFVDQSVVPDYLNAMDVLILGSQTTKKWIDTFPLATVQAQAVGIPVIASNSASIPWQLGDSALIYPEKNVEELLLKIETLMNDASLRSEIAAKGRSRSLDFFCHTGMTNNFMKIIDQVLRDEFTYHSPNEEYVQWKAY